MAFTAKKTDNSIAAVVNDFESTIVGGLQLLGYGYTNYAEEVANNFVRVAENFANRTPPESPLRGQLWWDTSTAGQPALWVCHNPSGATAPVTARWSKMFQVGASGNVDAYTLRSYAPSQSSSANTVVVRGSNGKIDAASLPDGIGATTLDGLNDVNTAGKANGSVLKYNGTAWVPGTASNTTTLNTLTDVSTAGAVNGSVLKFNGTSWVAGTDLQGAASSSVAWGNITGSLAAQIDLQNALNAKAASNHTHSISQISSLQSELNSKLATSGLLSAIKAVDGPSSGINADLLDGQHGAYYLDLDNATGSLPASSFPSSFSSNGWAKVGGLILQWGRFSWFSSNHGPTYYSYPIAFPNTCFQVYLSIMDNPNSSGDRNEENDEQIWAVPSSKTQFVVRDTGDDHQTYPVAWFAIGY